MPENTNGVKIFRNNHWKRKKGKILENSSRKTR